MYVCMYTTTTVQVAMCAYSFVHTLVNAPVLQGKHHQRKLQWVMPTMTASGVFLLVGGRKNTTSASCTVSKPSWVTSIRSAGCSNQMQVYEGKIWIEVVPLCKLHLVAASRSYTCAQDGLDTATCAGGVFPSTN